MQSTFLGVALRIIICRGPPSPQGEGFFHFAENLYRLRNQKGLSQQELADKLNLKRSAIGMYEQERQNPPFDKLKILADYFHVDMNTLLADGNSTAALSPTEQRHMGQYLLLDADNRRTIDDQTEYLLYRQTAAETKKDPA